MVVISRESDAFGVMSAFASLETQFVFLVGSVGDLGLSSSLSCTSVLP